MKKLTTIIGVCTLAVAMSFTSCKEAKKEGAKQENDAKDESSKKEMAMKATFKSSETAAVFQHYIHLKTALTNSDATEAKSGAAMLVTALGESNEEVKVLAASIAEENDLEGQRKLFSNLTEKMQTILSGALASGEIYKQFCPMAFNNTGGYWFSNSKEIKNPYYGAKMLKCGTIKETLQ
ncbi:MAG: DUF3347 domain-containing protein [Cellulophaga sp.]